MGLTAVPGIQPLPRRSDLPGRDRYGWTYDPTSRDVMGRPNPFAFTPRTSPQLPSAPWAVGRGTTLIRPQPVVNTGPTTQYPQPFVYWQPTRHWRVPNFVSHLGARASLTSWGFPSTWFTLRLPLAQPDLQTALSRRMRPVVGKFSGAINTASIRVPGVFVPIRPTGPAQNAGTPYG